MLDPIFGSHYAQSAIDLALRASQMVSPAAGVVPNIDEAIRLYEAAQEDAILAIREIKKLSSSILNWGSLSEAMEERRQTWMTTVEQLKQRSLRDPVAKKKTRRIGLSDLEGADKIPAGSLARIERLLRENKPLDAGELLHGLAIEYGLKTYEVYHLSQHMLQQSEKRRVANSPFIVDDANSDEEFCYIDVQGKGSVQIICKEDGLHIHVFPFTVEDMPAGSLFVTNAQLAGSL